MLTTVSVIRSLPGLCNNVAIPDAFLNRLIGYSSAAIKKWCKQNLELQSYVEFYSGMWTPDLIVNQFPIWVATTQVAAASNGAVLPQSTIYVNSTNGFDPGTGGNPTAQAPTLGVQTGLTTWTAINYTGILPNNANPTSPPAFTGCTGGTGTLSSQTNRCQVGMPVVFVDQCGNYGQTSQGFSPGTQQAIGSSYAAIVDRGGKKSNRGLLHRVGGAGLGSSFGFYPEVLGGGKLAAYSKPRWPRGDGNIKVCYSAGYYPIPDDLEYAASMLISCMIRAMPIGALLASEGLGGYSYSLLTSTPGTPEIASIQSVLSLYRESSW